MNGKAEFPRGLGAVGPLGHLIRLTAVTECAECGYVYEDLAVAAIAPALLALGPRYREQLDGADPVTAARRPAPTVWSALEYASHVRDVLLVQRDRVVLAQVEERPSFARMYRDERVELCAYSAYPIATVVDQLEMAARLCAGTFGAIEEQAWARCFLYNWPAPLEHDLAWLGRHAVHEGVHHLLDVRRALAGSTEPI